MSSKDINRRGKITRFNLQPSSTKIFCIKSYHALSKYESDHLFLVLAIQAKKKRKNPKGGRKGRGDNEIVGNSSVNNTNGTSTSARDARNTQTR